ncbi:hypothetical protein Tco_0024248 [Tanacetum coccineum]
MDYKGSIFLWGLGDFPGDSMGLVEEEEAYASESLAHSIGIGGDPIRRLQTHRVHACCSRDSYPSGDQHDGRDSPSVRGHKEEITDMQVSGCTTRAARGGA